MSSSENLCPFFSSVLFFFFNDTATTEIYTLSLHDALPISRARTGLRAGVDFEAVEERRGTRDRKSTRLNSSHRTISYAVFCLKKKKETMKGADEVEVGFVRCCVVDARGEN